MKFKYKIEGVDCPNCASKLAAKMAKTEGVDKAGINFLLERLTIESELDESVWLDAIKKVARDFDGSIVIKK